MNPPSSAREALLLEALGEMAALMERADQLLPALEAARRSLLTAATHLSNQVSDFEARMNAMTQSAQTATARFMALRAEQLTVQAVRAQLPSLRQAAEAALISEIRPALQTLQFYAQQLEAHQRRRRWWQ